jgi:hypothetical protein
LSLDLTLAPRQPESSEYRFFILAQASSKTPEFRHTGLLGLDQPARNVGGATLSHQADERGG